MQADTTHRYVCRECGSTRVEYLQGYFGTGVRAPDGREEIHWQEGIRCLECGHVEEV